MDARVAIVKGQTASLTITWAMVSVFRAGIAHVDLDRPGFSTVRSMVSASTGAGECRLSPPPVFRNSTDHPAQDDQRQDQQRPPVGVEALAFLRLSEAWFLSQ